MTMPVLRIRFKPEGVPTPPGMTDRMSIAWLPLERMDFDFLAFKVEYFHVQGFLFD